MRPDGSRGARRHGWCRCLSSSLSWPPLLRPRGRPKTRLRNHSLLTSFRSFDVCSLDELSLHWNANKIAGRLVFLHRGKTRSRRCYRKRLRRIACLFILFILMNLIYEVLLPDKKVYGLLRAKQLILSNIFLCPS